MPPLKRRHTPPDPRNKRTRLEHEVHEPKTEPASITIEAHEAHIITDKPSLAEAVSAKDEPGSTRGGLIRWFGETDEEIYVDRKEAEFDSSDGHEVSITI
ncbi:hypothetical protein FRC03_008371 [Tulasnella sp. 419]|nr:hypothetical protein FRC03_008371 [Tulasnella sp. 419]